MISFTATMANLSRSQQIVRACIVIGCNHKFHIHPYKCFFVVVVVSDFFAMLLALCAYNKFTTVSK